MSRWTFLTPFVKQCFVATGAGVHMAGATAILVYPSVLVLQLKGPDSVIPIDRSIESWIAATPAITGLLGSLLAAISISRFGRRISLIASIVCLIIGWLFIDFAYGVTIILIGRLIQGLAMGSAIYLNSILLGEYLSPKYRGTFMMSIGFLSSLNVLLVQTIGLYMHWRTNAIIFTAFGIGSLLIAVCSPESPSWLATMHKYEDCRRAFRWLRGDDEEEELANMIKASENSHKSSLEKAKTKPDRSIRNTLVELKGTMLKKAFYKPILVMIHIYTSGQWAGSHLMGTYMFDLIENIIGKGYNEHAIGLNVNRVLGALLAIYIITKTKRRTMYLAFSGASLAILLITAVYVYLKSKDFLPPDFPYVGVVLMHLHMFFITTCTLPMPYIIAGEIFPLAFKSIAGGFSTLLVSLNTFIYVKSFPYLLNSIGIHGAYTLYAGVVLYCLTIAYFYLPETKDRTLQEIEEEMTGTPLNLEELKSIQSLIQKPETTKIRASLPS